MIHEKDEFWQAQRERAIFQADENMTSTDFALLKRINKGEVTHLPKRLPSLKSRKRYAKLSQLGTIIIRLDNSVEASNIGKAVLGLIP